MVITAPMGIPLDKNDRQAEGKDGNEGLRGPGIRIIKVYEQSTTQHFYALDSIPKTALLDKEKLGG